MVLLDGPDDGGDCSGGGDGSWLVELFSPSPVRCPSPEELTADQSIPPLMFVVAMPTLEFMAQVLTGQPFFIGGGGLIAAVALPPGGPTFIPGGGSSEVLGTTLPHATEI